MEVGWETEPALEGAQNTLTLEIARVSTAPETPVENAEPTLRAGTETRQLPLHPVPQQPGAYRSEFVPPEPAITFLP